MKNLNFILKVIAIATLIILGISGYFSVMVGVPFFQMLFSRSVCIGWIYGIVIGVFNTVLFKWIDKHITTDALYKRRSALYTFLSFVVTAVSIFIINGIDAVFVQKVSCYQYIANLDLSTYVVAFVVTFVVNVFIYIFYFYRKFKEGEVLFEQQKRFLATSELERLRTQVDPHFLFNCLNVLVGLIDENPEKSKIFVQQLSVNYRYLLEHREKDTVAIADEVAYAINYIELLQVRFDDALFFEVDGSVTASSGYLFPLSLQILIENAVKHNIVKQNKPLVIKIKIEEDYLIVSNNLQPKEVFQHTSTKLGLSNLKQLYESFASKEVFIQADEQSFEVKIPILK